MKRWLVLIGVVIALLLVIGGIKFYSVNKMMQGFKNQPVAKFTVTAAKVAYQDWQSQQTAVGSVRAIRGADLSAEVAGIVEAIKFQSGDEVKSGALLVQLRAADDIAHLESLKASAELAQRNYDRDTEQFAAQAISKAVLDSDAATLRSAKAQVAEQQALLDKKSIRAPFAGSLGIRAVDLGQYLGAGSKIVTLQSLDPIYADFYLPQQALAQLKAGQVVSASSDTYPGERFDGEILAIDPQVDTATRNVQIRAQIRNPQHKLLPGMFANVSISVGTPGRYLTLPQTAISYNPYGETVYVLMRADQLKAEQAAEASKQSGTAAAKPDGDKSAAAAGPQLPDDALVAKQVFVTLGATRGDQVAVVKGLQEGDQVVTSGQLKLRNGAPVIVDNKVTPSNDADPKPVDE